MLLLDDMQPRQQIVMRNPDVFIVQFPERIHIPLGLDGQLGQIDGRKGEVAAAAGFFRAVDIAHDAGAAAHGCDCAVVIARLIVLQVVRRIDVHEIREQPLGARLAGLQEEIVVRIAFVVIHAGLQLEHRDRENRRLSVAESRPYRVENLADGQTALRRGVHSIVDGAERNLRAGPAVQGIEVVDQRLHRLMRLLHHVAAGQMIDGLRHVLRRFFRFLIRLAQKR